MPKAPKNSWIDNILILLGLFLISVIVLYTLNYENYKQKKVANDLKYSNTIAKSVKISTDKINSYKPISKNITIKKDKLILSILDKIKYYEGFRATAYQDRDHYTIGYGRHLKFRKDIDHDKITEMVVTKKEAEKWLIEDLQEHLEKINKHTVWFQNLDHVRQQAVLDITYNMGEGWFIKFPKAVAHLESGDYESAAHELLNGKNGPSKYLLQTGERAEQIAYAIRHGEWLE